MKLVLVRHGESIWNKENLFTGWTDVDLSETGEKEAADAGRTLLEQGYDFDLCYTSYLKERFIPWITFWRKWIAAGCRWLKPGS